MDDSKLKFIHLFVDYILCDVDSPVRVTPGQEKNNPNQTTEHSQTQRHNCIRRIFIGGP